MPWYIAIGLFLCSPAYALLVREKILPRLQDWWAKRSKRTLQARIARLKRVQLFHPEPTQLLIWGLQRLFLVFAMFICVIVGMLTPDLPPILDFNPPHLPAFWRDVLWLVKMQIFLIPANVALFTYRHLGIHLFSSIEEKQRFENSLNDRIKVLETALVDMDASVEAKT